MDPRARILAPYTGRIDDHRHRVRRALLLIGLTLLAMVMGFCFAILPSDMAVIPMAPVFLLAAIAIWIAPENDRHLDVPIRKIFFTYLLLSFLIPDYIAMTLPAVGWLSVNRLMMAILLFVSLYGFATSKRMRAETVEVLRVNKVMMWCFLIFFVLQLALGIVIMAGTKWIFGNIFWYYNFILAVWLFRQPGAPRLLVQVILIGAAVQGLYGLYEYHNMAPWWAGRIPYWLQVDPVLLEKILTPKARYGEGVRVGSIYLTALTYAEFIALAMPFAVYGVTFGKRQWARFAGLALIVLMLANGVYTDARSAMVGVIISLLGFTGLWALRRYQRTRADRDLLAPTILFGYPGAALFLLSMIMVHPRLRNMVLGGGEHQASNDAREVQWSMAIDRTLHNPFGYGPGRSGDVLGFKSPSGVTTIDSYPINLLLEYGVLGLVLFAVFFITAFWLAFRTFMLSDDSEETVAGPVAIALLSFIVIKLVLSQQENHYLTFILAGAAMALAWRQKQRLTAEHMAREKAIVAAPIEPAARPLPPRRPLRPIGAH